jgi:uncharacterized protein
MKTRLRMVRMGMVLALLFACTGIAQEQQPPHAFKGEWQGPTKRLLPGPGPRPGQSLPEYFASLPMGPRTPTSLRVLVLGGSRSFHHDSVPAAMDMVYQAGKRSGLWITHFATDFALINPGGGKAMRTGFQPQGLQDFDLVVAAGNTGEWDMNAEQKAALLAFVRDAGKGFVAIHGALDANHGWQDYIDMIGGEFVGHPFNTADKVLQRFAVVNESPEFPAVKHLPRSFRKEDEWYVLRNRSRADTNVLLRLDERQLPYSLTPELDTQLPPDRDFPVAWTKRYGKGRVFVSSMGHHAEAFDDPDVVQLFSEGIKWALGLSEGDERPHPPRN